MLADARPLAVTVGHEQVARMKAYHMVECSVQTRLGLGSEREREREREREGEGEGEGERKGDVDGEG